MHKGQLEPLSVTVSRPPGSMMWVTCRRSWVLCHGAKHTFGSGAEKLEGQDRVGIQGDVGADTILCP